MTRRFPNPGLYSLVRSAIVLLVALGVPASTLFAAPLEPGRAEGTFTVNGKTTPFKFAWSKKVVNEEGTTDTIVLLSDVALSKRELTDDNALRSTTEAGRAHTLQLVIGADKTISSVELHNAGLEHHSLSSGGSSFELTGASITAKGVSGKARTTEEREFFDDHWAFDARFNAVPGAKDAWGENATANKELLAKSSGVASGAANGTMTLNGKNYKLVHSYAKTGRNAFDKKKQDVIVLLSDQPVDKETFASDMKLDKLARDGKFHGMVVTISDEEPYHLQFYSGKESQQISGSGIFNYDSIQYSDKKAEARFYTKGTEDFFKTKYAYDVIFNAPVEEMPKEPSEKVIDAKSGTKLPAGGGEPWAAYLAYQKAINTADFAQVSKYLSKDALANAPVDPANKKEMKQMMELMKAMRSTNVKLVDGFASADQATMHVTGTDPFEPTKTIKGTVTMLKEAGAWKLSKEAWGDSADE